MKIAFLIREINVYGGTHKQFLKLLEYTQQQRIDFIVITKYLNFDKTYPAFKKFRNKIHVYDSYYTPWYLNIYYFRRYLKSYYRNHHCYLRKLLRGCDVVNVHDNGWEEEFPLMGGRPIFWQINDLPGHFAVGASKNHTITENDKRSQQQTLDRLKYVKDISVNVGKNAERVKEYLHRDAHVFYCGIEPVCIDKNTEETFKRFAEKKINILSSGHFFTYRNYETQIKVVKWLLNKGYDVQLRIMGGLLDVEYANKIKSIIKNEHLENQIIIEGQVDDERYKYLHQHADLFMFINIDQSWGLAVFEAMSCGLPVIVSESVGATEILTNNQNCIFVNPIDDVAIGINIENLVNNKEKYIKISNNASVFHKNWTWDKAYCEKEIRMICSQM